MLSGNGCPISSYSSSVAAKGILNIVERIVYRVSVGQRVRVILRMLRHNHLPVCPVKITVILYVIVRFSRITQFQKAGSGSTAVGRTPWTQAV